MIINDNSRVVNKLEALLTDDARVIIYDRHMFIVQATARKYYAWVEVTYIDQHSSLLRMKWIVGITVFIVQAPRANVLSILEV